VARRHEDADGLSHSFATDGRFARLNNLLLLVASLGALAGDLAASLSRLTSPRSLGVVWLGVMKTLLALA
jgi:hypothetical protein